MSLREHYRDLMKLQRIEFCAATLFFLLSVVLEFLEHEQVLHMRGSNYDELLFSVLLKSTGWYVFFLLLNFRSFPQLLIRSKKKSLAYFLLSFISFMLLFGVGIWLSEFALVEDEQASNFFKFFQKILEAFIEGFLVFILFFTCKSIILKLTSGRGDEGHKKETLQTTLVLSLIWLFSFFFLFFKEAGVVTYLLWVTLGLLAILFHGFFLLIVLPRSVDKKKQFRFFLWKITLLIFISSVIVFLISPSILPNDNDTFGIVVVFYFFHFFFTTPIIWLLFKQHLKKNKELNLLNKIEQTTADIRFLRSQINPHFLFNALNAIYGTALQENADRTAGALEKLATMMRFVLKKNQQEFIPLENELAYLQNYVDLQLLRIDQNPNIRILSEFPELSSNLRIAPMLLIPFVENAFKHGISFRRASYINISMKIIGVRLIFDVTNSRGSKLEKDTEEEKGGIGLKNVKQRLQLIYGEKHLLNIEETSNDYLVHLELTLFS